MSVSAALRKYQKTGDFWFIQTGWKIGKFFVQHKQWVGGKMFFYPAAGYQKRRLKNWKWNCLWQYKDNNSVKLNVTGCNCIYLAHYATLQLVFCQCRHRPIFLVFIALTARAAKKIEVVKRRTCWRLSVENKDNCPLQPPSVVLPLHAELCCHCLSLQPVSILPGVALCLLPLVYWIPTNRLPAEQELIKCAQTRWTINQTSGCS